MQRQWLTQDQTEHNSCHAGRNSLDSGSHQKDLDSWQDPRQQNACNHTDSSLLKFVTTNLIFLAVIEHLPSAFTLHSPRLLFMTHFFQNLSNTSFSFWWPCFFIIKKYWSNQKRISVHDYHCTYLPAKLGTNMAWFFHLGTYSSCSCLKRISPPEH